MNHIPSFLPPASVSLRVILAGGKEMTAPDPHTLVHLSHRPPGWDELIIPDPPKPVHPPGMTPARVHLAVAGLVLAAVWFGWALGRAWG